MDFTQHNHNQGDVTNSFATNAARHPLPDNPQSFEITNSLVLVNDRPVEDIEYLTVKWVHQPNSDNGGSWRIGINILKCNPRYYHFSSISIDFGRLKVKDNKVFLDGNEFKVATGFELTWDMNNLWRLKLETDPTI